MKEPAENTLESPAPQPAGTGIPISIGPVIPPRPRPDPPHRNRRNGPADWVLIAVCLIAVVYGLQSAGRRTAAELLIRSGSLEQLELAAWIDPDNVLAWRRLARSREDGADALRRSASLEPNDAGPWIELGLELETQQNLEGAERAMLRAAEADSGFLPRWTLANFYLRQGREEDFWKAIRATMVADPSQSDIAAALCWRAFGDSDLVLERAIPDDPEALRTYLGYLLENQKLAAIGPVWERLEPNLRAADLAVAADILDELLLAGDVELALMVWNGLVGHELIEHQPLALPDGPYLTNSDFSAQVSGIGFDWKVTAAQGVRRSQSVDAGLERMLEIRLSGGQDEYAVLMTQVALALPGEEMAFSYEYATQQLPFKTGMGWTIRDHLSEEVLADTESVEAAEDFWNSGQLVFRVPKESRLLRLELRYRRAPGTDRYRGRFVVRSLSLQRAADPAEAQ